MLLAQGRGRRLHDFRIAGAYMSGTTMGAMLSASVLFVLSGFAAPLSQPVRLVITCVGSLFVWSVKSGPLGKYVSLPEARRQIPSTVFGDSLVRGAWRFGFELGTGVRTYAPSPAPYVLVIALLMGAPTVMTALSAGLGFGIGRGLPLLLRAQSLERNRLMVRLLSGAPEYGSTIAMVIALAGAILMV